MLHSAPPLTTPALLLAGQPTQLVPSTAPLEGHEPPLGVPPPAPLHAMLLHDRQVLITPRFEGFPTTEVTLELWMQSIDICGAGVAFSYAAGPYGVLDNALLLFDYNNWYVCVLSHASHMCVIENVNVWVFVRTVGRRCCTQQGRERKRC